MTPSDALQAGETGFEPPSFSDSGEGDEEAVVEVYDAVFRLGGCAGTFFATGFARAVGCWGKGRVVVGGGA